MRRLLRGDLTLLALLRSTYIPGALADAFLTSSMLVCTLQRVVLVEYCKDVLACFQPVCRPDGTKVSAFPLSPLYARSGAPTLP